MRDYEADNAAANDMSLPLTKTLETILVVEDNPFVMKPVVMMLEHAGFKVLSASGAEQAIQIESDFTGTIHLLLSDVMMPGMSGPRIVIIADEAVKGDKTDAESVLAVFRQMQEYGTPMVKSA